MYFLTLETSPRLVKNRGKGMIYLQVYQLKLEVQLLLSPQNDWLLVIIFIIKTYIK